MMCESSEIFFLEMSLNVSFPVEKQLKGSMHTAYLFYILQNFCISKRSGHLHTDTQHTTCKKNNLIHEETVKQKEVCICVFSL